MEWWHRLWDAGFAPYCPHLSHFLHLQQDRPYTEWLDADNEWVAACQALFRFPGESSGADKEVQLAQSLGLPIFYGFDDLPQLLQWQAASGAATTNSRLEAFRLIGMEREYQDKKWGGSENDDGHDPADWVTWLDEYLHGKGRAKDYDFHTRMVKVAALAAAALEQIHRRKATVV